MIISPNKSRNALLADKTAPTPVSIKKSADKQTERSLLAEKLLVGLYT